MGSQVEETVYRAGGCRRCAQPPQAGAVPRTSALPAAMPHRAAGTVDELAAAASLAAATGLRPRCRPQEVLHHQCAMQEVQAGPYCLAAFVSSSNVTPRARWPPSPSRSPSWASSMRSKPPMPKLLQPRRRAPPPLLPLRPPKLRALHIPRHSAPQSQATLVPPGTFCPLHPSQWPSPCAPRPPGWPPRPPWPRPTR
jgi:hypothetical protein